MFTTQEILSRCLIDVVTVPEMVLEACFILKKSFTVATLNRSQVSMLVFLVAIHSILMDELVAYITLHFTAI